MAIVKHGVMSYAQYDASNQKITSYGAKELKRLREKLLSFLKINKIDEIQVWHSLEVPASKTVRSLVRFLKKYNIHVVSHKKSFLGRGKRFDSGMTKDMFMDGSPNSEDCRFVLMIAEERDVESYLLDVVEISIMKLMRLKPGSDSYGIWIEGKTY